jgi:hypothetical protein
VLNRIGFDCCVIPTLENGLGGFKRVIPAK